MSAAESTAHGEAPAPDEDGAAPDGLRHRALASAVQELSDRIEALQADVRRLGGPGLPQADAVWEGDEPEPGDTVVCVGELGLGAHPASARDPAPAARGALPGSGRDGRGIADLEAAAIAGVMAGAWVLVALIEWAAARAERRRDEIPAFERLPATGPAGPCRPMRPGSCRRSSRRSSRPPESRPPVTLLPPAHDDHDATVERPTAELADRPGASVAGNMSATSGASALNTMKLRVNSITTSPRWLRPRVRIADDPAARARARLAHRQSPRTRPRACRPRRPASAA